MMKIVIDKDIPFIKGVLEPFFDVIYIKGVEIDAASVSDADALLIRTRTKCNASLLSHSKVSFIGSATIGTDHIDSEYLKSKNIFFANAPGCNAGGVMQYVLTAMYAVSCKKGIPLENKTLGVIGVGNTGGKVAALGEHLGFHILRNDPPKEAVSNDGTEYCSLDYLLNNSDIVSMHVPLDNTTRSMASEPFFSKMKEGTLFINASRGEAMSDAALLKYRNKLSALILDVWNGEPDHVLSSVVSVADIATPHIAGYSYEGKINGTKMIVRALASYFHISQLMDFEPPHTQTPTLDFFKKGILLSQDEIMEKLIETFPIYELDSIFRSNIGDFEKIRSNYNYRREFNWK